MAHSDDRALALGMGLLRSIPIFEGLAEDDLRHLAALTVSRRYKAGEIIFNQGDSGTEMYIVAEGHVNIHLPGEASRRVSLKDIARGEYFGELALFDDKPRSRERARDDRRHAPRARRARRSRRYLERRPRAAMAHPAHDGRAPARDQRDALASAPRRTSSRRSRRTSRWSDRLADKVAELNGSWAFILGLLGAHRGCGWSLNVPASSASRSTRTRTCSSTCCSRSSSRCRGRSS